MEEDRSFKLAQPCSSRIPYMPIDLISIILSLIPVESALRFKRVSRLWHQLITSDPLFIQTQLRRAPLQLVIQNVPLVDLPHPIGLPGVPSATVDDFLEDKDRSIQLKVIDETKANKESILSITYRGTLVRIYTSCNGLLYFDPGYVCNPLLGECLYVPNSQDGIVCGFFFHPASNQYRLLRWTALSTGACIYAIFALGGEECWRRIECSFSEAPNDDPQVMFNDSLHWISDWPPGSATRIIAFDINSEIFRLMQLPQTTRVQYTEHLFEMEGYLCFCQFSASNHMEIWMLADYENNESWERKFIFCPGRLEPHPRCWGLMSGLIPVCVFVMVKLFFVGLNMAWFIITRRWTVSEFVVLARMIGIRILRSRCTGAASSLCWISARGVGTSSSLHPVETE